MTAATRVVAYLRVSTQQQAEHGLGLDVQRVTIREWAKGSGCRVVAWHADEGISGSNGLETRVGLYEALRAVEEGDADGLVVYRLDRLARDLVLQETLLARLWSLGASAYSTVDAEHESLVSGGDDPTRNLTRQILGAIAQYERALIVMRLRSGKLAKRVRGGYIGGAVPYGYELHNDQLIPAPDELAAVELMRQMRADGSSLRTIIAELDRRGIPPKTGRAWYPTTVATIVERSCAA